MNFNAFKLLLPTMIERDGVSLFMTNIKISMDLYDLGFFPSAYALHACVCVRVCCMSVLQVLCSKNSDYFVSNQSKFINNGETA